MMANRRPIRRLPFPRRGFRRRKPAFGWTNGTFDHVGLDVNGGITRLNIIDHTDFEPTGLIPQSSVLKLHRVQLKGFVNFEPVTEADEAGAVDWLWALWLEDADETDSELWGDPGNLIAQKRIIKWDYFNVHFNASSTAGVNDPFFSHGNAHRVMFDIKARRPLVIGRDDRLILAFQPFTDYAAILANANFTAFVRVSAQTPGSGR